ncbi:hypothetical protein [Rhizobium sp. Leaf262]|uniref:hypothetical protein n=1 Tax=Rhizobium sp. Leaf262 TaxID=1736312 RepID=UPI000715631C|nr:hypothetical protein [Rhizobium sp. Leaf262]KQO76266.1 hypothetical protein ASF29_09795 [Rhizobium sp. Leaf262]
MTDELYCDGIGEITVTASIVRLDLMSLSATVRDGDGNPSPVFRQRIIMPVEAFANAVDLMQKALGGLIEAGAVHRNPPLPNPHRTDSDPVDHTQINSSPNFN